MSYTDALPLCMQSVKSAMMAHVAEHACTAVIAAASCDDMFLPSLEVVSGNGLNDNVSFSELARLRKILSAYAEQPYLPERFEAELLPALVFGIGAEQYMLGVVAVILHYEELLSSVDRSKSQLKTVFSVSDAINATLREYRPSRFINCDGLVPRVRFVSGNLFDADEQSGFNVSFLGQGSVHL